MNPMDLTHFATLLKARTGIEVDAQKDYLIQSRLTAIAGTAGHETVDDLLRAIRLTPDERVLEAAIDAMTTNETLFFRDQTPFDHLRKIVLEPARRKGGTVRIWSAACSTGQEPYSIAMLWDEMAHHLPGVRLEIMATDYSNACLAKARAGIYSAFEVQRGLPVQKLMKHFEPDGPNWRVKDSLRQSITWRRHNLLDNPAAMGRFDVIFCRNVLIYFDRSTRGKVFENLNGQLKDDGYLILGASENVMGVTERFKGDAGAPGLFVKAGLPAPLPRAVGA